MNEISKNNTAFLLDAFCKGDNLAFSELYDMHINILLNYGMHITTDKDLLKDCIHDVFIKIFNKRSELKTVDNFRSYIFISLKNRIFDELRKQSHMSDISIDDVRNEMTCDNLENEYINKESLSLSKARVKILLDKLPNRQREAITLYYLEERKYEDICELMDMNYQSVRNLIHRGVTKLRGLID